MKASELIRQLADAMNEIGDLEVTIIMPDGLLTEFQVALPKHYVTEDDFFPDGDRIVIDYDTSELEKFSDGDWLGSDLDEGGPEVAGEGTTRRGDANDGYMAWTSEGDCVYECNCGGGCECEWQNVFDWLRAPPTQEASVKEGPCDDDSYAAFLHRLSEWEDFQPRDEC